VTSSAKKPTSLGVFADKARRPTATELTSVLGPAAPAWSALIGHVNCAYPSTDEQWNFASARFGWSLRLKKADRVILYLIPQAGRFLVGIVLGAKAVAAAKRAGLPAHIMTAIAEAPRYAEGTGFRLPVESASDLPAIETLTALKMAYS
jgi:hypothetical protein